MYVYTKYMYIHFVCISNMGTKELLMSLSTSTKKWNKRLGGSSQKRFQLNFVNFYIAYFAARAEKFVYIFLFIFIFCYFFFFTLRLLLLFLVFT